MLEWTNSLDDVDWDELSEVYRVAPLGTKPQAGAMERGYLTEA